MMNIAMQSRLLGPLLEACPDFLVDLGKLESKLYQKKLADISIREPIFVCGLARSGSTILLELLDQHSSTASFRYYDFPFVYFPVFWRNFSRIVFNLHAIPVERAHQDRLKVSPLSPEAFEEILWMQFFKDLHKSNKSQIISSEDHNDAFERFYSDTIKKILLTEHSDRYLSKGNYNIGRIGYLKRLFPGAKFIIPVRHPVAHVASLMKQHDLFSNAEGGNPAILRYMQRAGHFEFGMDRRAINLGCPEHSQHIDSLFRDNKNLAAYACQWNVIYSYAQQLADDASVRIIQYEDFCAQPASALGDLYNWLGLATDEQSLQALSLRVSKPDEYQLVDGDIREIMALTGKTATFFGYR